MMYVWLNIETGKFSNSWTEEQHDRLLDKKEIEEHYKNFPQWKLIRYESVNDKNFEFTQHMKLR